MLGRECKVARPEKASSGRTSRSSCDVSAAARMPSAWAIFSSTSPS